MNDRLLEVDVNKCEWQSAGDMVKKPSHYQLKDGTEVKDHIKSILSGMEGWHAYCIGNVIKYVSRAGKKNGKEDLKKAKEYLEYMIDDK